MLSEFTMQMKWGVVVVWQTVSSVDVTTANYVVVFSTEDDTISSKFDVTTFLHTTNNFINEFRLYKGPVIITWHSIEYPL